MVELQRYIKSKGYQERADSFELPVLIQRLKRRNLSSTIVAMNDLLENQDSLEDDEVINKVYDSLLFLWG